MKLQTAAIRITIISALLVATNVPPICGIPPGGDASRPAGETAVAAQPELLYSGPQVGEVIPPLSIIDVNGGRKDRVFDPRIEAGGGLTLYVFFRGPARPVSRSIGQIDAMAREIEETTKKMNQGGMRVVFIGLMPDRLEGDRRLRDVWMMLDPKAPANISNDGVEGPGAWGLNSKCQITAVLAKNRKVIFNHATTSPGDADDDRIRRAVSEAVGFSVTSKPAWAARLHKPMAPSSQPADKMEPSMEPKMDKKMMK